jgi:hypothetical protein
VEAHEQGATRAVALLRFGFRSSRGISLTTPCRSPRQADVYVVRGRMSSVPRSALTS